MSDPDWFDDLFDEAWEEALGTYEKFIAEHTEESNYAPTWIIPDPNTGLRRECSICGSDCSWVYEDGVFVCEHGYISGASFQTRVLDSVGVQTLVEAAIPTGQYRQQRVDPYEEDYVERPYRRTDAPSRGATKHERLGNDKTSFSDLEADVGPGQKD